MKLKYIDVNRVLSFPVGQQYDHNALTIKFINIKYEGDLYILINSDWYNNLIPLENDSLVIAQPLTNGFGQASGQLYAKNKETNQYAELSRIFYMNIAESLNNVGEQEYPLDPNLKDFYDRLDDKITEANEAVEKAEQATQDCIEATNNIDVTIEDQRGYFQGVLVDGDEYSGKASNSGIKLHKVVGKTVQDGEPSPDNEVPIQNVNITKINAGTNQLFDASKLSTTSKGGATVTNNGDGSFTVSGSGNLTDEFANMQYSINSDDFKKLFKVGNVYLKGGINKGICFEVKYIKSDGNLYQRNNQTINLTNEIYNAITSVIIIFYGNSGSAIPNETIKPMLYQDGDGAWEPFKHASVETSITLSEGDTYENGQITRLRKQITFDGSSDEGWSMIPTQTSSVYRFANKVSDSASLWVSKTKQCCNRLPVGNTFNNPTSDCFSIDGQRKVTIYIDSLKNATLEEFKTWLSTHNLVVEYELATPTIETLKVPTVPSYYPNTNVWADNIVPTEMQWKILADSDRSLEVEAQEKRIAALEKQLIGG